MQGMRPSQPTAGTGDDDDLVFEGHGHGVPRYLIA
jgi:hypothetical protein